MPLTKEQREAAATELAAIKDDLATRAKARDYYTKGYVSPEDATALRAQAKSPTEYARQVVNHGDAFLHGANTATASFMAMLAMPSPFIGGPIVPLAARTANKLTTEAIGLGRTLAQGAFAVHGAYVPAIDELARHYREQIDKNVFGVPIDPIERSGYEAAYPKAFELVSDIAAFAATAAATDGLGEAAMIPRVLKVAGGARMTAGLTLVGGIGGGVIASATAPDSNDGFRIVKGVTIGLGAGALVSTALAGRGVGAQDRLLRLAAMQETMGATGMGAALRVAPRLAFGRLAQSGMQGGAYVTLSAMGQGESPDKAVAAGVESALEFVGYDIAFMGFGKASRWLPVRNALAQTWAQRAESMGLPSRLAAMTGKAGAVGAQAAPGAILGGLVGGPAGAAIGGAISARNAAKLQAELLTVASRLKSTGAITDDVIQKVITGNWKALSGPEAASVTKALLKDTVETVIGGLDRNMALAVREAMGSDAVKMADDVGGFLPAEISQIRTEYGQITKEMTELTASGVEATSPEIVQRSRRLFELAERHSQLLDEIASEDLAWQVANPATTTSNQAIEAWKARLGEVDEVFKVHSEKDLLSKGRKYIDDLVDERFAQHIAEEDIVPFSPIARYARMARELNLVNKADTAALKKAAPAGVGRVKGVTPGTITEQGFNSAPLELSSAREWAAKRGFLLTYNSATRQFALNSTLEGGSPLLASAPTLRELWSKVGGMSGEAGFVESGLARILGGGFGGAFLAPIVLRSAGLTDENDSLLAQAGIGFAAGALLGAAMLRAGGAKLSKEAEQVVAKFTRPTVEDGLTREEAAKYVGKLDKDFKTTINGKQVGGRRLYNAMPHEQQIAHTVEVLDRWPGINTFKDGKRGMVTLTPDKRKAMFERDLLRFAPYSWTPDEFDTITKKFFATTEALGYNKNEAMKVFQGWLGWTTTPLADRGHANITKTSLKLLAADAKNPFNTAKGIEELRQRATLGEVIAGPPMPLPQNYRNANSALNKHGVPEASVVAKLQAEIEANMPTTAQHIEGEIVPWWSFVSGLAPTARFYRYADQLVKAGDAVGQLIYDVTHSIFEGVQSANKIDHTDRTRIVQIFRAIDSREEMEMVRTAVENKAFRESLVGKNDRVLQAADGVRQFLREKADLLGLPDMARIEDYFPWIYNYRTRAELAEMAKRGVVPNDRNFAFDMALPKHVSFNNLKSRTADSPLGERANVMESLLMYSHGANRKYYMDQMLANITPEKFAAIRKSQPWLANDLGKWVLDTVGVPTPGTLIAQRMVEQIGLKLESVPMFNRMPLAREILDRYFFNKGGASGLSRLATSWAYNSKIAFNFLSAATNVSQMILNGATEYGLLNVLVSSGQGLAIATADKVPVLAPIIDAFSPKTAEFRRLLTERGILSETAQRHFDALAQYEARFGTNRAHFAITSMMSGAIAGAAGTAALDHYGDYDFSIAGGAATGAALAGVGAYKSQVARRALGFVRDLSTFSFNMVETWNRATIGTAGIKEARATLAAEASPVALATKKAYEVFDSALVGTLGGAAIGHNFDESGEYGGAQAGAIAGGALGLLGSVVGESRTTRTARALKTIRESPVAYDSRIVREQAKVGLRAYTDDEVATLYAQMQTDLTQFRLGKEGRGYYLNTPLGQAMGALQSYTLNQAEFVGGRMQSFLDSVAKVSNGEGGEIDFRVLRYGAFVMALGAVYTSLIGTRSGDGDDPDYWVSRFGFGVTPFLVYDDTAKKWKVLPPTDMFKGPLVGDITRTANSLLKLATDKDAYDSFPDAADDLILNLFPGARAIKADNTRKAGAQALSLHREGTLEVSGAQAPRLQQRQPR